MNIRTTRSRRALRHVAEFYPYATKRALNAVKREATAQTSAAIRTGILVRQPCCECGKSKSEAHHEDYAKPLDVQWLCRFHHRRRDAVLRDLRRREAKTAARNALPLQSPLVRSKTPFGPSNGRPRRTIVLCQCSIDLVRQATTEIAEAVDLRGMSEHFLSRKMNVSRQVVNTQFAGGIRTLKVLAAYADALDCEAVFVLRPKKRVAVAS